MSPRRVAVGVAMLLVGLAAACSRSPEPAANFTVLPTKEKTSDRARQGVDAASAQANRQRAEIDSATR